MIVAAPLPDLRVRRCAHLPGEEPLEPGIGAVEGAIPERPAALLEATSVVMARFGFAIGPAASVELSTDVTGRQLGMVVR